MIQARSSVTRHVPARVVMVVREFPKLSESFLQSKFRGLLDCGWDVHVVCSASEEKEWKRIAPGDQARWRSRVHEAWPARPRWLAVLLAPAALVGCALRNPSGFSRYVSRGWARFGIGVLRRLYLDAPIVGRRPELVHFEFGTLAAERVDLRDLLGCHAVVSFRGFDLTKSGLDDPDYYAAVWKMADAVHFLGEDLRRRALRRGLPPDKVCVLIPPAVDTSVFDPGPRRSAEVAGGPSRPLRVLSVGRLDWRKGYEYALEAIRLIKDRGQAVEYRIVGEGEYREAVAFARHQLELEGDVDLLGSLAGPQIREQMKWADLFLHAAVSEGFSNAVLEAQSMAVPVVTTDAGGLPENVSDGESGFVVPRRDADALAGKLLTLARDPGLRRRLGEGGRRRVLAYFRAPDQIAAFEKLYHLVLGSGGPAAASDTTRVPRERQIAN